MSCEHVRQLSIAPTVSIVASFRITVDRIVEIAVASSRPSVARVMQSIGNGEGKNCFMKPRICTKYEQGGSVTHISLYSYTSFLRLVGSFGVELGIDSAKSSEKPFSNAE